jgi:hypothetical protein
LRPGKKVGYDISIAHPSASVLGAAPLHLIPQLLTASEREKEKVRKYQAVMRRTGDNFVPIVLETHGAVSVQAQRLLRDITERLPKHEQKDFREWSYLHLYRALQRGNAAIWQAAEKLAIRQRV